MASEDWMSTPSLNNRYDGLLEKEDFFSLVRHYETHFIRACEELGVDVARLGEDGSPSLEALKFKSIPSFEYGLDKTRLIESDNEINQYEYLVSFIGLLGSAGVLPQHYIKLSLERIKHGDFALSEFIGIFEHRLISLYYKAIGKYKLPAQYGDFHGNESDNFSCALKGFSGFHEKNDVQLFYSGHYAKNNRPLVNLKSIVSDLVKAKISTQSMVGNWLPIAPRDRCKLGARGKNNKLGSGVILGKRYWDIQSKIVISIHDIDMNTFLELQAGKPRYILLASAINAYVPVHISVYLEFHVKCIRQEMTPIGKGFQLASNAWLMSKPKNSLVSKCVLTR